MRRLSACASSAVSRTRSLRPLAAPAIARAPAPAAGSGPPTARAERVLIQRPRTRTRARAGPRGGTYVCTPLLPTDPSCPLGTRGSDKERVSHVSPHAARNAHDVPRARPARNDRTTPTNSERMHQGARGQASAKGRSGSCLPFEDEGGAQTTETSRITAPPPPRGGGVGCWLAARCQRKKCVLPHAERGKLRSGKFLHSRHLELRG